MGNYRRFAGCIWDVCARGANTSRNWLVILAEARFSLLLCFCSSFQRKLESSFGFVLDSALTASLRFSARIRASGSLSLACARESNQREHTPGAALPAAVRKVRPGFARWASCPFANSRASLRATLSGDSGLPSPRLTGPRIKSNGNSKSCFASVFRFLLLRAGRARSGSSRGTHGLAAAAVDQAP